MTSDPTTIIQRYFDQVWGAGDMQVQEQLIAPGYTGYWLIAGMPVRQGPASHRDWVDMIRAAMPDLRYTVEDVVAGPEKVAARHAGRHQQRADGRPAAHRQARHGRADLHIPPGRWADPAGVGQL